jgi:hypothetical protein
MATYKQKIIHAVCLGFALIFSPLLGHAKSPIKLIEPKVFGAMSWANQVKYVSELQSITMTLEVREQRGKYPLDSRQGRKTSSIWDWIITEAQANEMCSVGGVFRKVSQGKCPTWGRPCGQGDNFLCGVVFGNACISREPVSDLSNRCFVESQNPDVQNRAVSSYPRIKDDIQRLINSSCDKGGGKVNPAGCEAIKKRLAQFENPAQQAAEVVAQEEVSSKAQAQAQAQAQAAVPRPTRKPVQDKKSDVVAQDEGDKKTSTDPAPVPEVEDKSTNGAQVPACQPPSGGRCGGFAPFRVNEASFSTDLDMVMSTHENAVYLNERDFTRSFVLKGDQLCLIGTFEPGYNQRMLLYESYRIFENDPALKLNSPTEFFENGKAFKAIDKLADVRKRLKVSCEGPCPEDKARKECAAARVKMASKDCNTDVAGVLKFKEYLQAVERFDKALKESRNANLQEPNKKLLADLKQNASLLNDCKTVFGPKQNSMCDLKTESRDAVFIRGVFSNKIENCLTTDLSMAWVFHKCFDDYLEQRGLKDDGQECQKALTACHDLRDSFRFNDIPRQTEEACPIDQKNQMFGRDIRRIRNEKGDVVGNIDIQGKKVVITSVPASGKKLRSILTEAAG